MDSPKNPPIGNDRDILEQAIAAIESRRELLGNDVVNAAVYAIREKLAGIGEGSRSSKEPQQRKLITVLFADVSGFTAMAETMDHEIVNDVINSLWSRVDKAIMDLGGRIDKHIGDAIMALYGTPTAHEDDPERAIRSALQIQSEILEWKGELSEKFADYRKQIQNIQLRIGVNTGPALLGTVGLTNEYTAIGDTVNLANRLETAAPKGGILISHDTHALVRGVFDVTELDPITVKGKSEPIQVYTVQSVKPRSFRDTTRGLEGIETRTIGRENELQQMKDVFNETVSSGMTHLITLMAEAGTGKSRLLFEFGKWLDSLEKPIRLFRGRAIQESTHIPYSLLRGILSSSFDIRENDSATTARQKLEEGVLESSSDPEKAEPRAHFIGHLIGLDYSMSPHLKGILEDARQVRDRAFHFLTQMFADLTSDQTLVILLEDIHWADTASLDFFDSFMEKRPDLPVMIVSLARSTLFEHRPGWGTGSIQSLLLNVLPLSEEDTRLLIREILQKVPEVPEPIMELIVKKAEGSPFYVEELIKVLIEGQVIVRNPNQWLVELKRLSDLKVPATLTGLLQARLDGLTPNILETLQQASVVGRVFWMDIVDHMRNPEIASDEVVSPIRERINSLNAKELIYNYEETSSKESSEFIFKNQILHDVTYESVLLRLRPIYHSQAAEGLVEIGGERINEFAGRVGEHYERAEAWTDAADWYIRAGKQAQNTYAPDSALHYYEKALEYLDKYGTKQHVQLKLDVMQRLGEVLNWKARYAEAVDLYSRMIKEAEADGNLQYQSRATQFLAVSLGYQGDHQKSLDNAILAEKYAREANAKLELAGALRAQGSARFRMGDFQTSQSQAEASLALFTELNNQSEMAKCLNQIGAVHYVSGRLNDAESNWEKALNIFQELGNRQAGMELLSNLGVVADGRGDYETALQRYDGAVKIARETGYKNGEIVFLTNRGGEYVALENYEAAEADLRQAIQLAGRGGSWCLPLTYDQRAEALVGLGKYEEAFNSAYEALLLAEEDQITEYLGMVWRTMGMICHKINDVVRFTNQETKKVEEYDAETCFTKSIQILTEAEIEVERARTLREWALYELSQGKREKAEKMWQEARDILAETGAFMEVERMKDLPK